MSPTELTGLTDQEAAARLRVAGPNELPSARERHVLLIAWDVLREPMFLLLVAGAGVYLALGDLQEAVLLLGSISVIIGITFYQERKTERALEALRDLSSPQALVIRASERRRIPGRDVVPGDLVVLSEGDRVPADGVLHNTHDLAVDESLLTGESVPVRKTATTDRPSAMGRPGGDDLPFVYSGTLVVQGQGIAEVLATGARTEIGQIGSALQTLAPERTRLQEDASRLAGRFAVISLAVCVLVAVAYGATRGDWLTGILVGITLAMSLLPEEIPVVLTVFLALGAWRISQHRVLTRRIPAIEALGAATVLCVDKTGTLTQNRMRVARLATEMGSVELRDGQPLPVLAAPMADVVRIGLLASETDAFDPLERALVDLGEQVLSDADRSTDGMTLIHEYALTPTLLAVTHIWLDTRTMQHFAATKGAPEAIFQLCRLDEAEVVRRLQEVATMAEDGLRVIGVARSSSVGPPWPDEPTAFPFTFVGLIGLADPVRPSVPAALAECHRAGIRVVMITGDFPTTARAIARDAGLWPLDRVLAGSELAGLDEKTFREQVRGTNIFARVIPQQKLRLVEALKQDGEVVAMTGDGVNDAPALKAAHIGIAMGGRGTDVAREAASLVLLDDDFASIVRAVRLGRRIFDNLKKAMAYIFAVHVPIAGAALVPVLLQWPLILLPIHVVFLELIIDPACSIVFEAEPEEPDVMDRPPRDPTQAVFDGRLIGASLLQGAGVLVAVLGMFGIARAVGLDDSLARALAFSALVAGNLGLIFASRSPRRFWHQRGANRSLNVVTVGAVLFLLLALYLPPLASVFRFSPPDLLALVCAVGAGLASSLLTKPVVDAVRHSATA